MFTFAIVILQYSECDVTGSSGDVQNLYNWIIFAMCIDSIWSETAELIDERMFPISVNAHRHEIIHDIVLVGDRVEDLIYEWLFLLCGHIGETEVIVLFFR